MKAGRPVTDLSAKGRSRRRLYLTRRINRKCTWCQAKTVDALCKRCSKSSAGHQRKLRLSRKAAGLCQECGEQANYKTRCQACVERRNNRPSRTYAHRWQVEYQFRGRKT